MYTELINIPFEGIATYKKLNFKIFINKYFSSIKFTIINMLLKPLFFVVCW